MSFNEQYVILDELFRSMGDDSEIEGFSDDAGEESMVIDLTASIRQDPLGHIFHLLNNDQKEVNEEENQVILDENEDRVEVRINEVDVNEEVAQQEDMEVDDEGNDCVVTVDQTQCAQQQPVMKINRKKETKQKKKTGCKNNKNKKSIIETE